MGISTIFPKYGPPHGPPLPRSIFLAKKSIIIDLLKLANTPLLAKSED